MELEAYFQSLIERVEASDIQNNGKDENGFYKPTRSVLLQRLNLLKDLHSKPHAKAMVRAAWQHVVKELPAEWLVLTERQKTELKSVLES